MCAFFYNKKDSPLRFVLRLVFFFFFNQEPIGQLFDKNKLGKLESPFFETDSLKTRKSRKEIFPRKLDRLNIFKIDAAL
jgi:hypothetical protein